MPITAYTGLPRSGKTYQVVSHVILGALRDGRRVVSNIAGLQYELMYQALLEEGVEPGNVGQLVPVTHDQVQDEHFFRTDTDQEKGVDAFIQPGDVVVLDEVWRYWEGHGAIDPRAMNFFRMHGHFAHPDTGFICEIALISQSVADINRNIRRVVDETYRMTKDTAVGSDKTYLVEVFQRGSEAKRDLIRSFKGYYNPKYFPLYKSHSQAKEGTQAKEVKVDKRGNVLRGPLFRIVLPLFLLSSYFLVKTVTRFFHPDTGKPAIAQAAPGSAPQASTPAPASSPWRVVGWYSNGATWTVLAERDGAYRAIFHPAAWELQRTQSQGLIDGTMAGSWSGGPSMMAKAAGTK